MRYTKPIELANVITGTAVQYCWHVIVYVKNDSDSRRQFIRTAKRNGCTFAREEMKEKKQGRPELTPIPCQDDTILAYELFIPDCAGAALDSLCVIGKGKRLSRQQDHLADYQLQQVNRNKPILDYHFIGNEKIPYGMGKVSGMQKANRKLADDNRGKDTAVQHGTPLIKPTPMTADAKKENGKFATVNGTKTDTAIVKEITEKGLTAKRMVLPIVSKPQASKGKLNEVKRQFSPAEIKSIMDRCKQYEWYDAIQERYLTYEYARGYFPDMPTYDNGEGI